MKKMLLLIIVLGTVAVAQVTTIPDTGGGGVPSGAAGGDLGTTYPNPSVVKVQGTVIDTATPSANGSFWGWSASGGKMVLYALGLGFSLSGFDVVLSTEDLTHINSGTAVPGSCTNINQEFYKTDTKALYRCNGSTYEAIVQPTATALAANGTNCTAGNYARGTDASGNAEDCTAAGGATLTAPTWLHGDMWIPATSNYVNTLANRVHVHPYRKPYALSFRRVVWRVTTGNASGMCGFAVYNAARTSKIFEVTDDCSASSTNHSIDIGSTQTLAADTLYWIAYSSNDVTLSTIHITMSSASYLLPSTPNTTVGGHCGATDVANFGAAVGSRLPASCGTITTLIGAVTYPALWLEAI